jgi:PEP-CTERM motif
MRKSISIFAVLLVGTLGGRFASATSTCNGVSNNLVANCSFQSDSFTSWTGSSTTDFFSFVASGDPLAPVGSQTPPSGQAFEAILGSFPPPSNPGPDSLTQALTTVAGEDYTIEYDMLNTAAPSLTSGTNSFEAEFGSDVLFNESEVPLSTGFTLFSFTGMATSSITDLTFLSDNAPGEFDLASISVAPDVAATPEPGSLILLGTALLGLAGLVSRRVVA